MAQTTLLFDDFEDGDHTSNPLWYDIGSQHETTIIDDSAGLGSGNAAQMDFTLETGTGSSFLHAEFPEVTLNEVGDYVEVTFDLRITSPDHETKPNLLRFGLYDQNGTSAADNLAQDGVGYFAQVDVGERVPAASIELRRNRTVSMFNATFNPDQFGGDNGDEYVVTFDDPHSVLFRIERTVDPFDPGIPDLEVTANLKGPGEEDNEDISLPVLFEIGNIDTFSFGDFNIGTRATGPTVGSDDFIIDNVMVATNLEVATGVPGDYNEDGTVDAADYTVWRDNLGQAVALPNEDPSATPGQVTMDDYDIWKSQFGQSLSGSGSLSAQGATVPEPASWVLLALAAGLVGRRGVARGRKSEA